MLTALTYRTPQWFTSLVKQNRHLILVILVLWAANFLNYLTLPVQTEFANLVRSGHRATTGRHLSLLLLLPCIAWTVTLADRARGSRWKAASIYLLGGVLFIPLQHVLQRGLEFIVKSLPYIVGSIRERDPQMTLALYGFRFVSEIPTYLILVLIKHQAIAGQRMAERELRASQLETQLLHSKLESLRGQIQPHFLFNALSVIYAHIPPAGVVARQMTRLLSTFLRGCVSSPLTHAMTLRAELEFQTPFLEIHKLRFGERLIIEQQIPEACMERMVPHFILQPLVENALKHGVGGREGVITVRIRAWEADGLLYLAVEDEGGIVDPRSSTRVGTGAGHRITTFRLQHLFRRADLFTFGPMEGGGYRSQVGIPLDFTGTMGEEPSCA